MKVKVVKNKVAAPFKAVMLDILFGSGIDSLGCTLDAALDLGIVERRGSWYAYKGQQLAQGRTNAVDFLRDNEIGTNIAEDVRQALTNLGKGDSVGSNVVGEGYDDDIMGEAVEAEEESLFE